MSREADSGLLWGVILLACGVVFVGVGMVYPDAAIHRKRIFSKDREGTPVAWFGWPMLLLGGASTTWDLWTRRRRKPAVGPRMVERKPEDLCWIERTALRYPEASKEGLSARFEVQFLHWLIRRLGAKLRKVQMPTSWFWHVEFQGNVANVQVLGPHQVRCEARITPDLDWLLRVDEGRPLVLTDLIASKFRSVDRPHRVMDAGEIRTQFRSTDWLPESSLARD